MHEELSETEENVFQERIKRWRRKFLASGAIGDAIRWQGNYDDDPPTAGEWIIILQKWIDRLKTLDPNLVVKWGSRVGGVDE